VATTRQETIEARRNIVERARRFGSMALAEGDAYNVRRKLNIIEKYSQMPGLGFAQTQNWNNYYSNKVPEVLVMLLVILLTSTIFTKEHSFNTILLTTKNGLRQTFLAKISAASLLSFLLSVLCSLFILSLYHLRYNLAGLSKPIISVDSMAISYLSLTIWQYTLLFIAVKAFGAALLALICCFISSLSHGNLFAYAYCTIFLGFSYVYSNTFDRPQVREIFKMPDLTLWFKPERYFSGYFTANVLGYPVPWVWIRFICWLLLSALLVFIGCRFKVAKK
jgi:hypothetical protein